MPDPTRPKYSAPIEQRHSSLLDSLVSIMGYAPDSINVGQLPFGAKGATRSGSIRVKRPDDVETLLHELGHFQSVKEARASGELADSLRFDPYNRGGAERLADTYAALLRVRNDTTQTNSKDAKLLYRILGRIREKD